MSVLDYETAGESHGPAVLAFIRGLPAGLPLDLDHINAQLRRRQGGYGRGGRQRIESDQAVVRSGVRHGRTMGSPLVLEITNRDSRLEQTPPITRPRPGHADLAGSLKWLTTDCRCVVERASARETAARVAAGGAAACLLEAFGIEVVGFVVRIGTAVVTVPELPPVDLRRQRDMSEVYCPDPAASAAMVEEIRHAMQQRDTVGGEVEVRAFGVPPGLGSCMRWQDKLDGRLMQAVGSIQAIKGVQIGAGFAAAERPGSLVHDEIDYDPGQVQGPSLGFTRRSNNVGGIEGGMSNGQCIVVRAAMKPISTLLRGLDSVDLATKQPARADYERSDICAVPAASVVAEAVVAFEIARALREKFGGDTLDELRRSYEAYLHAARAL